MSWISIGIAAVSIGVSAYEYSSQPGAPKPPDVAGASRAGVEADAETLADRRRLEAAAQQGTSTTYTVAAHDEKQQVGYVSLPAAPGQQRGRAGGAAVSRSVPYVAADWQAGGKYFKEGQPTPKITYRTQTVHVPAGPKTADFTGYGTADVQGAVARKSAQNIYDLQKKYGPGFIDEALKEEALADPEGTAARKREYELIKEQEDQKPDRPVANLLEAQVGEQLKAGKGLDSMSDSVLREAVGKAQAARGGTPSGADFSQPLTTGFEGEGRLTAAEQKALGWLTSGATPEDVDYRREQQTLADLSSFANNKTPQSQFAALSGAQTGPAPYSAGRPLATQNPGAGAAGQQGALSSYGTQLTQAENTANGWMAGISAMLKGASAANTAINTPRTV